MSIAHMNQIGREKGLQAAISYADVAQLLYSIRKRLKAGDWDFDGKLDKKVQSAKPKLREVRQVIDRNGDKRLVKVSLGSDFLGYQVEYMGENGDVIRTEGVGKLSLAEARALIGKSISHPVPTNAGTKTNDPTTSRAMKGASTGGGKKGK